MLNFSVTFIITIVNIVILTVILRAILFKPVTKFMAARAKRVEDAINQAEKDQSAAQELLRQYQDTLNNAQTAADAILNTARAGAEAESRQIIADGKTAAEAFIAAARVQIESERQTAFARFKGEAAALVIAASARLVQRELSGDDNSRYAAMLLDELSAQKGTR